uniref:Uncharacterized protein n=1 Tax=Setaria italica TaxID=4555 RepID=K3YX57_SETIT
MTIINFKQSICGLQFGNSATVCTIQSGNIEISHSDPVLICHALLSNGIGTNLVPADNGYQQQIQAKETTVLAHFIFYQSLYQQSMSTQRS